MRAWTLGAILILALTTLLVQSHPASAACAIMTNAGMQQDFDCDGVIDQIDNCPYVPNAGQGDMNRNGIGDVCDVLIEEILVSPDSHVRQGDIAHLVVRLVNNRNQAAQGITVMVRNSDLGIEASQQLPYLPQGEMAALDYWLLVPKCASPGTYSLSVSASSETGSAETQRQSITVEKGTCGTPDGPLDTTLIQAFNEMDIDQGESALLPISISNLGDSQATYDLSVANMGPFATWRIDPAPHMTLPSGHSDTVYLYLQTDSHAQPGQYTVTVTVTSGNQKTTIPVKATIRSYKRAAAPAGILIFQGIIILLLIILIIVAIILAIRHSRRRRPDKDGKYVHIDDLKRDGDGKAAKVTKTVKTETKTTPRKTVSVENAESKVETYY